MELPIYNNADDLKRASGLAMVIDTAKGPNQMMTRATGVKGF